jgi:hypothetical protein
MTPLAIDLFCGLGGWTEGLKAVGYRVVGFDNECHRYGPERYPAQLVLQDVLTIHGSQFKGAALIVASPPCQAYSYRAMPWKRAKALPPPDNALFEACFRIQREASAAAGHHVPMVVENVRGAQKWVGRSNYHYGSFHLWGDVPALMPLSKAVKVSGVDWSKYGTEGYKAVAFNGEAEKRLREGTKHTGGSWCGKTAHWQSIRKANPVHNPVHRLTSDGVKCGGDWFGQGEKSHMRKHSSKSTARRRASAMIAKIPRPLSEHIGRMWWPPQDGK